MVRRWSFLAGCLALGLLGVTRAAWSADNLIFVPLQPCRVIDTRVPGAGGPLVAGAPRTFFFRGPTRDYATSPNQGGNAAGCGIPDVGATGANQQNIAQAVAINIVAVGPAGAGDLRAWPANLTVPNASVINYAVDPGPLNIANGVIVPMCSEVSTTPCTNGDITFRADVSGTHLVVDVVGYFHAGSPMIFSNTAVGHGALQADTTGFADSALGDSALSSNTTGNFDSASGAYALAHNTTGNWNTALGGKALRYNTTGSSNTGVGAGGLAYNTIGQQNTAVGAYALFVNSTGNFNTAIGSQALGANTTGYSNTANGAYALHANTTAGFNTALGADALRDNTTGSSNTASGAGALAGNSSGSNNTANGEGALGLNATGHGNTASGAGALLRNSVGNQNTAAGYLALSMNTTGIGNTAVGYEALENSTGGGNVALGLYAGSSATTGNHNIFIANSGAAADAGTIRIGDNALHTMTFIAGIRGETTGNANAINVVIDSNGQLGTVSSSIRFKEDVHDLGAASDRVLALRPVSFRYRKPFANGARPIQYGLIAEEVEKVFPELVAYGRDGRPESVKYQDLPTLLLNELEKEHAELERERSDLQDARARLSEQDRHLGERDAQIAALADEVRTMRERLAALERAAARPAP